YMEHVLNDQFDPVNRGIYITDSSPYSGSYLFNKIESLEPTYLHNESEASAPLYLFSESEVFMWGGFVVNVPSSVVFDVFQLKAYVNKYKIASKSYSINVF